jgi:hypothetical protein
MEVVKVELLEEGTLFLLGVFQRKERKQEIIKEQINI